MTKRRVVVTGLGMVSPLGLAVDPTWQGILAGKSGVVSIPDAETSQLSTTIYAPVKNFDPTPYMPAKDVRKIDPFIQYGMAASAQAIEDAKLEITEANAGRIGVAIGSGIGGITTIEQNSQAIVSSGPRRVSPFFIPSGIVNMVAGRVSIVHGLKGPNISVVSACTTGTHNIGMAARMISYGDADVMLAGGAESAATDLCLAGFAATRALSKRNDAPEKASRPWDKGRDGFVLGEGAGVLILESYEHAKARGATIYAELAGYAMSADGYHITLPDQNGAGATAAMKGALADAGMQPNEVDYVNAHATSTPAGDELEALAIKKTFDSHAVKLAVSSTKSMTGHLLGAAGAIEAIFSVLAIRDQIAPPTINLDDPGDGCDLDFVPYQARKMLIRAALSNSFGFGGTNGSLVFKRVAS